VAQTRLNSFVSFNQPFTLAILVDLIKLTCTIVSEIANQSSFETKLPINRFAFHLSERVKKKNMAQQA
jgi:hypothetical protein